MELSKQVTSLEISKKLKELGVRQESLFDWYLWDDEECTTRLVRSSPKYRHSMRDFCSAFTVGELGEILPQQISYDMSEHGTRPLYFTTGKTIIKKGGWYCLYSDPHPANKVPIHSSHGDTEADNRGKMLIYLLERGLVKVEALNEATV